MALSVFLTRLLIRAGVGRLLPGVRRLAEDGTPFLRYYSDAVLGAPHFDDARKVLVKGDAPVPSVRAEIHQAAAMIEPGLHRIPHRGRMIFRMRAG